MSKKNATMTITIEVNTKPRHGVHFTKHQDSKKVKNKDRKAMKKFVKEYFNV